MFVYCYCVTNSTLNLIISKHILHFVPAGETDGDIVLKKNDIMLSFEILRKSLEFAKVL